jgi:hypothetical protein
MLQLFLRLETVDICELTKGAIANKWILWKKRFDSAWPKRPM